MRTTSCFLQAVLGPSRIALPLEAIDRVVRAVQVRGVPARSGCLLGTIDVAGEIVSVHDLQRLLGLQSAFPIRSHAVA